MDSTDLSVVLPGLRAAGWAALPSELLVDAPLVSAPLDEPVNTDVSLLHDVRADELDAARHWVPSLRAVGARYDAVETFDRLRGAYTEPHRHHHTLRFVAESLANLARWSCAADRPHEVALAIWFKDAVFDPLRHDNEGRSARMALDCLTAAGVPMETARRVRDLVVATRHDSPPATADGKLLVDIDLAWLGGEPDRALAAERSLRRELSHVSDFIYRRRRIEALKALTARLRIFHSDVVREHVETRARANIVATIARLQSRVLKAESLFQ